MVVSEKTPAEMRAGAEALARAQHAAELPPGYLDAILNTQARWSQLRAWERAGLIRIEKQTRYRSNDPNEAMRATIIHVGENRFTDELAERAGSWPSEILMAEVALAVHAGQGDKNAGRGD